MTLSQYDQSVRFCDLVSAVIRFETSFREHKADGTSAARDSQHLERTKSVESFPRLLGAFELRQIDSGDFHHTQYLEGVGVWDPQRSGSVGSVGPQLRTIDKTGRTEWVLVIDLFEGVGLHLRYDAKLGGLKIGSAPSTLIQILYVQHLLWPLPFGECRCLLGLVLLFSPALFLIFNFFWT